MLIFTFNINCITNRYWKYELLGLVIIIINIESDTNEVSMSISTIDDVESVIFLKHLLILGSAPEKNKIQQLLHNSNTKK